MLVERGEKMAPIKTTLIKLSTNKEQRYTVLNIGKMSDIEKNDYNILNLY
jgi:hypothetical protein